MVYDSITQYTHVQHMHKCSTPFNATPFNTRKVAASAEGMNITQIAGMSWAQWNANLVMPLCQLQEGAQPLVFASGDRCSSPESNDNDGNEDDSSDMPTNAQSTKHTNNQHSQKGNTSSSHSAGGGGGKDTSADGSKSSDGESKNGQGYSCPECGRFYKLKSSLRNHQKWECGKEPQFSCPFCVYKAKQKMHINRHLERMHKEKIKLEMSNGIQVVNIKDEAQQNLNATV